MERFDPDGQQHVAGLRLNRLTIDLAAFGKQYRPVDGFIPFQDLNRIRRYAEVLGYELTHAYCILNDPHYTRASQELHQATEGIRPVKGVLRISPGSPATLDRPAIGDLRDGNTGPRSRGGDLA